MKTALVGDIGGTNARFALWRDQRIEQIRVLPTADHARPELAIRAYLDEVGVPAFLDFVEKGHGGPAALATALAFQLPIFLIGIKPVIMRFEFLPRQVALALYVLSDFARQAQPVVDSAGNRLHEGIVRVEIARIGRAEFGDISGFM